MRSLWERWSKARYVKPFLLALLIFLASAAGFYFLELSGPESEEGFFAALYWTMVTLTTVGYGDIVPKTMTGRALSMLVMVSGIGLVSTLTGTLSSFLVERRASKRLGLLQVDANAHVIILGWNANGQTLITNLTASQEFSKADIVVAANMEPEAWEEIAFKLGGAGKLHFVKGNPALESIAVKTSPGAARMAYILSQDGLSPDEADQQSLYTALTFKTLAPKVPLYAEVSRKANRDHLLRAGATEVIARGDLASRVLASIGTHPGLWDLLRAIMGESSQGEGQDSGERLGHRPLTSEEKGSSWHTIVGKIMEAEGVLPLAVYSVAKDLSLQDLLNKDSALDSFIIELFAAAGQNTSMGEGGSRVVVNPQRTMTLESFDGLLFLRPALEND